MSPYTYVRNATRVTVSDVRARRKEHMRVLESLAQQYLYNIQFIITSFMAVGIKTGSKF